MRKIENKKGWLEFIADCNRNTVHLAKFGLSQNGNNIDCFFNVYRTLDCGFDLVINENMMCSDEGSKKLVEPPKYFDDLQKNYSTPFFVTDTGDNFTWL